MATHTQVSRQIGNLVIDEWNTLYTREAVVITTLAAYEGVPMLGMPITNLTKVDDSHYEADLVLAGAEASAEGVIVSAKSVDLALGTSTERFAAVVRGPVIINKDKFPDDDAAGAAFNKDAIAAALAALPGTTVVCRAEPEVAYTW
jgi:hypothetical protein